jgi:hypothetical protein
MRVPHDHETQRRIAVESSPRPALLGGRAPVETRAVGAVVSPAVREPSYERYAEVGMEELIHG